MALKMSFCTLRWKEPDLEAALEELKKVGWSGWEGRLPLDWLGSPSRVRQVCRNVDMPVVVYTASSTPDDRDWAHVERNRRRMEYAAEVEADCFMFMSGAKPKGRPVDEDDVKASAEAAESWAQYAAQFDLEISYHIHTNTLIDSTEHWKLYMSLLDKTKLCIDVSHAELWDYDPVASIRDFRDQINYIHLQDYSSTSRAEDGSYLPIWCDVGEGQMEFDGILQALEEIGYDRWVTSCPGEPIPGADDALSEARRSANTRQFLRQLGH